MVRRAAAVIGLIVSALCAMPTPGHAQTPPPIPTGTPVVTPAPAGTGTAAIVALLKEINRHRKQHGARALVLDTRESTCSKKHSRHMAAIGHLAHDQFPADICVPYQSAAENIGYYGGDLSTALTALDTMMMAEGPCPAKCTAAAYEQHGHYMNLINPAFREIGIGVIVRSDAVWLTEDFTG